ncbi:multicopper oxidase domain-containing protein [Actinomadura sp. CNU-125]|uniref:multicopper oxidase domain-containing protein n=1 Tax=Actinomadura sp. CNU-125 TaxID=1904961 RepID=UPI0029167F1C|nr:multicopper oxidase domain-containing protein [Actinomadura sp. CNU-125]
MIVDYWRCGMRAIGAMWADRGMEIVAIYYRSRRCTSWGAPVAPVRPTAAGHGARSVSWRRCFSAARSSSACQRCSCGGRPYPRVASRDRRVRRPASGRSGAAQGTAPGSDGAPRADRRDDEVRLGDQRAQVRPEHLYPVRSGVRVRLSFVNRTTMRHPLHGHTFAMVPTGVRHRDRPAESHAARRLRRRQSRPTG